MSNNTDHGRQEQCEVFLSLFSAERMGAMKKVEKLLPDIMRVVSTYLLIVSLFLKDLQERPLIWVGLPDILSYDSLNQLAIRIVSSTNATTVMRR